MSSVILAVVVVTDSDNTLSRSSFRIVQWQGIQYIKT